MSTFTEHTTDGWWQRIRPRLTILYIAFALLLLLISGAGHLRLLGEVGQTFGGFFWAIDTDGRVVVVSTPTQLPSFGNTASFFTGTDYIVEVNGEKAPSTLTDIYHHVHPGQLVSYRLQNNNGQTYQLTRPAVTFTLDMWWQNYGLAWLAGISWLLVGMVLLATAKDWIGAIEGITLLPAAMLFLLYSHLGNVQHGSQVDIVFQLLWIPSFALLGAAFIHLSLVYRPETLATHRSFRLAIDGLPYLPLIALVAFEGSSYLIFKQIPIRPQLLISLGYGVLGGVISFFTGITSLLRVSRSLPGPTIPDKIRYRLGELLTLWMGGVGLGFCLGVLPILLTGQLLLPLPIFYVLATVYPLLLFYAIRSLRLISRLQTALEEREEALYQQQRTVEELRESNRELQRATSLLLHADAHLRSLLSQRIHDQPKQQALRIRSLLGHWQHKLKGEAERNSSGQVSASPIIEALEKIRKISEELEGDLRGLQLLVEDAYQRRSLGLRLHLEKLIREDLPGLHPESRLKIQPDLWALDALSPELEQTETGEKLAEAISYTVTQALLNVYNHAGASFATVRAVQNNGVLEVYIIDDGRGFDPGTLPSEKTSLFKAELKAREAGGTLTIQSIPRPQVQHGTTILLRLPIPFTRKLLRSGPLMETEV